MYLSRFIVAALIWPIGVAWSASPPAQKPQKPKEAWEYLNEPAFKQAYIKALGPKSKTAWLARRDGPAPEDKFVTVGGERYVKNAFCAKHACADNSAVLLYHPAKKVVYGTIYEKGKTTYIGDPPAAAATELEKTWKAEWRSTAK